jgi:hypothetical protein
MLPLKKRMAGHQGSAVEDFHLPASCEQFHRLTDQREGYGVPVAPEAHQVVVGHDTAYGHAHLEAGLPRRDDKTILLPAKTVQRLLVGRAVDPHIRHRGDPLGQLLVEVDPINEGAAGKEVALDVLDPALDLALGLGPIGSAQTRLESPVVGESLEGGVPANFIALGGQANRTGAVVEMFPGVSPEVIEGPLVGFEELGDPLVGAGAVERAPGKSQREGEQVHDRRTGTERHPCLSPVDLALKTRRGLKSEQRPLRLQPGFSQRPDKQLDGIVAAPVPLLRNQLLVENPRRVTDLRGAGTKKLLVRRKKSVRARGSRIGMPLLLSNTAAYGVAVHAELPGELPDGNSLLTMPPADLFPHFPSNHTFLLSPAGLRRYEPILLSHFKFHQTPSLSKRVGEDSVPILGDYWVPADNQ